MFLDNWYKLLLDYNKQTASGAVITVVAVDGTSMNGSAFAQSTTSAVSGLQLFAPVNNNRYLPTIYGIGNGTNTFYGTSSAGSPYGGILIGDGDTPPTLTDYCLSGNQITTFTATTTVSSGYSNGKITGTGTYNITNTGESAFTIKEIGLVRVAQATSPYKHVMVAREVLETPITIQPGQTGVLTYKIEIT